MMRSLERGQRLPLVQVTPRTRLTTHVRLPGLGAPDLSLFGLDEHRRLVDDRYFVFYNQTASPEGALTRRSDGSFRIDLDRLPVQIHRLLLAATLDEGTFAALRRGSVSLADDQGAGVTFALDGDLFVAEQAVMLLELYRHGGGWRVAAVGQGFGGGLQALLESLGGEVVENSPAPAAPPPAPTAPLPPVPAPPRDLPVGDWPPLRSALADLRHAQDACRRCGRTPSFLRPLNIHSLCRDCARQSAQGLSHFRTRFLAACANSVIEFYEWQDLQRVIDRERLDARQALEFVRPEALHLMERTLTVARSDGQITEEEVTVFGHMTHLLQLPANLMFALRGQLQELREATLIRDGRLPTVQTGLILDAGEIAHLETPAVFRHVTATRSRDIPGRLIVTNRQIHFVSLAEGGWNIQYGKVLRIEEMPGGVNLELGVKKGSGYYHQTPRPLVLAATLDALARAHKRLKLLPQTERASRSIPQQVKLEVWQRDAGKCVQCGDGNYLEYDHVIPHSLGGASTANNLQLLCRRCNLTKSDRL
ncbi:TerD family protein [Deinococcus petrolearius]|uniref:TerD family protein n=1 Tax=Deinococcus petrolearius TaxID=1751295 RepID=A0ABW1DIV8_9DEIO